MNPGRVEVDGRGPTGTVPGAARPFLLWVPVGPPSVGGRAGWGSWAPRSRQRGTEVDLLPLAMRAEGWAFGAGTWDLFWACSFSRSQLVKGLNWRTKNFSVS